MKGFWKRERERILCNENAFDLLSLIFDWRESLKFSLSLKNPRRLLFPLSAAIFLMLVSFRAKLLVIRIHETNNNNNNVIYKWRLRLVLWCNINQRVMHAIFSPWTAKDFVPWRNVQIPKMWKLFLSCFYASWDGLWLTLVLLLSEISTTGSSCKSPRLAGRSKNLCFSIFHNLFNSSKATDSQNCLSNVFKNYQKS